MYNHYFFFFYNHYFYWDYFQTELYCRTLCIIWHLASESESVSGLVVSNSFDPMDGGPPGFSVHGILQARTLECAAIRFSGVSSRPRDRTQVSLITGRVFTIWATREAPFASRQVLWLDEFLEVGFLGPRVPAFVILRDDADLMRSVMVSKTGPQWRMLLLH